MKSATSVHFRPVPSIAESDPSKAEVLPQPSSAGCRRVNAGDLTKYNAVRPSSQEELHNRLNLKKIQVTGNHASNNTLGRLDSENEPVEISKKQNDVHIYPPSQLKLGGYERSRIPQIEAAVPSPESCVSCSKQMFSRYSIDVTGQANASSLNSSDFKLANPSGSVGQIKSTSHNFQYLPKFNSKISSKRSPSPNDSHGPSFPASSSEAPHKKFKKTDSSYQKHYPHHVSQSAPGLSSVDSKSQIGNIKNQEEILIDSDCEIEVASVTSKHPSVLSIEKRNYHSISNSPAADSLSSATSNGSLTLNPVSPVKKTIKTNSLPTQDATPKKLTSEHEQIRVNQLLPSSSTEISCGAGSSRHSSVHSLPSSIPNVSVSTVSPMKETIRTKSLRFTKDVTTNKSLSYLQIRENNIKEKQQKLEELGIRELKEKLAPAKRKSRTASKRSRSPSCSKTNATGSIRKSSRLISRPEPNYCSIESDSESNLSVSPPTSNSHNETSSDEIRSSEETPSANETLSTGETNSSDENPSGGKPVSAVHKSKPKWMKQLDLKHAISDVKEGKLTRGQAIKKYTVPEATLRRHLNKDVQEHGGKFLLSPEEEATVVDAIRVMGGLGLGFVRSQLEWVIGEILREKGIHKLPSPSWFDKFQQRYSHILCKRMPEKFSRNRAVAGNQQDHDLMFNQLESLYDLHDFHSRPEALINFDEKPHSSDPGQEKVFVARGSKDVKKLSCDNDKMKVSVCHTAVASGKMLPPLVIYRGKSVMKVHCEGGPEGTVYAANKTGNMTKELMLQYFERVLVPYADSIDGDVCCFADGFRGHISLDIIRLCIKHGIHLFFWPSHTSDKYQMLDKGLFGPAQSYWEKTIVRDHLFSTGFSNITKEDFPALLNKLYASRVFSVQNVQNSYRGFYPLDRKFLKEEVLAKTVVFSEVDIIPREVDSFVKSNRLLVDPVTGILTPEASMDDNHSEKANLLEKMVRDNIDEILRNFLSKEESSVCLPWAVDWNLLELLTVWSYHVATCDSMKKMLNHSDLTKFRELVNLFKDVENCDNDDGILLLATDLLMSLLKKAPPSLKPTLTSNVKILKETLYSRGVSKNLCTSEENCEAVGDYEENPTSIPSNSDRNVALSISEETISQTAYGGEECLTLNPSLQNLKSPEKAFVSNPGMSGHVNENCEENILLSPCIPTKVGKKLADKLKERLGSVSFRLPSPQTLSEDNRLMKRVYGDEVLLGLQNLSNGSSKASDNIECSDETFSTVGSQSKLNARSCFNSQAPGVMDANGNKSSTCGRSSVEGIVRNNRINTSPNSPLKSSSRSEFPEMSEFNEGSVGQRALGSPRENALWSAREKTLGSAGESALRSAEESALLSTGESALGSAEESELVSAGESALGSAEESELVSTGESALGSAEESELVSTGESALGFAEESALGSAGESALGSTGESALGSTKESVLGSAEQGALGSAGESALGSAEERSLRFAKERTLGSAEESARESGMESTSESSADERTSGQIKNFIRCPCQLNIMDSSMLFCAQCVTLQHAVCFRVTDSRLIESHACLDCSERLNINCTDYNLREVGDKDLIKLTCLYRRVVSALTELSIVNVDIISHASKIDDKEVIKILWHRLVKAEAIRQDTVGEHYVVDRNVLLSILIPSIFGWGYSRKKGLAPANESSPKDETVTISSSRGAVEVASVKNTLVKTIQKQFRKATPRKPKSKKELFKVGGNFLATSEMIENRFIQQQEEERKEAAVKERKKQEAIVKKKAKQLEREQKIYEKQRQKAEKDKEKRAKEEERIKKIEEKKKNNTPKESNQKKRNPPKRTLK